VGTRGGTVAGAEVMVGTKTGADVAVAIGVMACIVAATIVPTASGEEVGVFETMHATVNARTVIQAAITFCVFIGKFSLIIFTAIAFLKLSQTSDFNRKVTVKNVKRKEFKQEGRTKRTIKKQSANQAALTGCFAN
jgi:hypothetical protein